MLAFDIETEGLNKFSDRITVASIYDPERDIKHTYNFLVGDFEKSRDEFLKNLDDADALCAFNGARFDIPFIIQRFNVPAPRYTGWLLKLHDIFEVCKLVFGSSCSLNNLLIQNGHSVKTGTGMQAVIWAREGNWVDLEEYCMQDTVLTYEISTKENIVIPLTGMGNVTLRREGGDASVPVWLRKYSFE